MNARERRYHPLYLFDMLIKKKKKIFYRLSRFLFCFFVDQQTSDYCSYSPRLYQTLSRLFVLH